MLRGLNGPDAARRINELAEGPLHRKSKLHAEDDIFLHDLLDARCGTLREAYAVAVMET